MGAEIQPAFHPPNHMPWHGVVSTWRKSCLFLLHTEVQFSHHGVAFTQKGEHFLIYPKTPDELAATHLGRIRDSSNKMRKVEALNEKRMKLARTLLLHRR